MTNTTSTETLPPANWYEDPADASKLRWWGGLEWTHHVKDRPILAPAAPAIVPTYEADYSAHYVTHEAEASQPQSALTPAIWVLAVLPLISFTTQLTAIVAGLYAVPFGPAIVVGALLSVAVIAVVADRAGLQRRGYIPPSALWIVVLPAIGYLIARQRTIKRQGGRANAPGNVYVASVVLVGAIYAAAATLL